MKRYAKKAHDVSRECRLHWCNRPVHWGVRRFMRRAR